MTLDENIKTARKWIKQQDTDSYIRLRQVLINEGGLLAWQEEDMAVIASLAYQDPSIIQVRQLQLYPVVLESTQ